MRTVLSVLVVVFMASAAWAGLPDLPNELADPGFEQGGVWTIYQGGGMLQNHLPYAGLAGYGVPGAPNGGSYCGGVAVAGAVYPGGELSQIVDESLYPGWNPDLHQKLVEVEFSYLMKSLADVNMHMKIHLDYMMDEGPIDPGSELYRKDEIGEIKTWDSGGWQFWSKDVVLPVQPRYLSLHLEFLSFTGTGINIVDNVDLQGKCVPEPGSLLALGTGLLGLVGVLRRRR